jgi:hypothetical protein
MPSSLAELPGPVTLRGLCQRYDQAYEALVRDDLERVALLLQETEAMLATLTAPIEGDAALLHRQASDSQGRLMAALDGSMAAVQSELGRVRRGKRALQGYGARGDGLGVRHESRS